MDKIRLLLTIFPVILLGLIPKVAAQGGENSEGRLEIIQADRLLGGRGFDRLMDEVILKHQQSLIYCDSAHFYGQENLAKLFGNVRIVDQEDPITVTSRYAEYDGNTLLAKLRNNVVFKNKETTLYTDYLNYNRQTAEANYFNTGKVVDSTNVLTSENGLYETQLERITFTEDVVLENPDYILKSNKLVYLTIPKTAETEGITNVTSTEGNKLNAKREAFTTPKTSCFDFMMEM